VTQEGCDLTLVKVEVKVLHSNLNHHGYYQLQIEEK
jgi:hypothetical protein